MMLLIRYGRSGFILRPAKTPAEMAELEIKWQAERVAAYQKYLERAKKLVGKVQTFEDVQVDVHTDAENDDWAYMLPELDSLFETIRMGAKIKVTVELLEPASFDDFVEDNGKYRESTRAVTIPDVPE